MKRFIIISLLSILTGNAFGCAVPATHNYYLFSSFGGKSWNDYTYIRTLENWRSYAGKDDLDWFSADTLRAVARKKGDALMVSYLDQLEKYLEIARLTSENWEYPSKKELARRREVLGSVQQYALSKIKTRLRSQHALLYMRCNMLLGQHQKNVSFWEKTANGLINSIYRDMMRNIYAGALLKTGRADEATQIFIEQGDTESLYTYFYEKRSLDAIRKEYQHRPDSPALTFLLQDFANNTQEAIDAQDDAAMPGKLFIRDIKQSEAMQMADFARQVVKEGKTDNPVLWKSTEAWMQYLFGSKEQALACIREAVQMEGQPRSKDNARVLRLYIEAGQAKADGKLDDFLADELAWLDEKAREERGENQFYENHYTQVYDRLVHQVLVPSYIEAGRTSEATAFLAVFDEQPKIYNMAQRKQTLRTNEGYWNEDYSGDYFQHIDTMPVAQLEKYLEYSCKTAHTSKLDKWLSARFRHDAEFLHELIGTKYLRLTEWAKAEKHLEKVSIRFINTMNIVPFMARRSYTVEPWMNRQRIKSELQNVGTIKASHNQKLEFARDMLRLEQGYATLAPTDRPQRAYELAVCYMQASYQGDAWYLTRYGKSSLDEQRSDEEDFIGRASQLLTTAQEATTFAQKEKAYFAKAYLPIDSWYTDEWNDQKADFDRVPQPRSHQYQALQALVSLERQNASGTSRYVSRCDVLKQFLKAQ